MEVSSDMARRPSPYAANAFDAVAWRAPSPRRFDSRPANDEAGVQQPADDQIELPRWAIIVGGGVLAALMGAMVGGGLAL